MWEVHKPALAAEVANLWRACFAPQDDEKPRDKSHYPAYPVPDSKLLLVDATLGEAGHARQLLAQEPRARLIGLDADPQMLARATQFLSQALGEEECQKRCRFMGQTFSSYFAALPPGELQADLILFDLGISLFHYQAGRGFSFRPDDPDELLDMRLNPEDGKPSASELLHSLKEEELADIFWRYAELRNSRRIARAIVELRQNKDAAILNKAEPFARFILRHSSKTAKTTKKAKIHPATQVFQALRIAVNDELGQLQRVLPMALEQLRPYGLLAVISFHSLEDRLVKQQFRQWQEQGRGQWVYRKAIQAAYDTPLPSERSAKLRVIRCLPPQLDS